jgi:hypothetical protein
MGERIERQPLLIVCASRNSLLERRPYWGEGLEFHHCIDLQPLSKRESQQLVCEILKLAEVADIVFWPVAIDAKYKDVEALADHIIDVCFFNGGIRNSEQEHLAKLLRKNQRFLSRLVPAQSAGVFQV